MAGSEIPLIGSLINRIFGSRNERFVKRFMSRVEQISRLEPRFRAMSDNELRATTASLKSREAAGEKPMDLMVEAFALAREVMDRSVGVRNIFNPRFASLFDASRLDAPARALYEQTKAAMEAAEPRQPEGDLLGCTEPQPGWLWMEIPTALYDAVRALYPESRPPFRARPFDVQLVGGMVLFEGRISEMKTGEGKTIVAPLAAYLGVVSGYRVNVVTVNDYLVQRDRDWTFPFFHWLGLTVGAIHPMTHPTHPQREDQKRVMYQCDVVYGTTSEFGFDYLRDNMKNSVDQQVQRVRDMAIVDEVDSILIDEARTPLIISGAAHDATPPYELADSLARHLVQLNEPWSKADEVVEECKRSIKGCEGDIRNAKDKARIPELQEKLKKLRARLPELESERDKFPRYFEVERERKQVHLTPQGISEAQKKAGIGSFYVGKNIEVPHALEQSLRAHAVYERDRDYIVVATPDPNTGRNEQGVVIVDTNTGRPMHGRQWSDGLHQAVEAKERVRIKEETQTVATITIQNFFKMYKRLSGMTGTADTEAQEFHDIYKLDVVAIPTNLPVVRRDFDDVVYMRAGDKWDAIVDEIKAFHDIGRPVLVGTTSVEKSETLSRMLTGKHAIKHEVLNAKQHDREAHIVENAGQLGAVMIATNMAGRGTDIKLGTVTRQAQLDHWLRRGMAPRELTVDATSEQVRELVYRKIAPKELGLKKEEAAAMPAADLELALLRHWAQRYTMADPARIAQAGADELREALDRTGRTGLHSLGWVSTIEELGGLHVIGTERHESRRIDNQLRGRGGRQGDKGSSRFFVSLEDDLMKLFAGDMTMNILSRLGMKEGDAIEHPILSKSIVRAQRKVEERNFQYRKNLLEYDEVMEHQRRSFYGTRQRVIEGRDMKGLILEFIEAATVSTAGRLLDPSYAADCASEYVRESLGVNVPAERLRRKDADDMAEAVRRDARDEARHEIHVTLGEFYSEQADGAAEIEEKGLMSWAATRFRVELTAPQIHSMTRQQLAEHLHDAASRIIEEADLSRISEFIKPDYGRAEFCKWLKNTMDLDFTTQDIARHEKLEGVIDMVLERVREVYKKREIEFPVDFILDVTMAGVRQNPQAAMNNLMQWASQRLGITWTEAELRTKTPQVIRDELLAATRRQFESNDLERRVNEALACKTNAELEKHFAEKYNARLPLWMLRLRDDERADAIRARVESFARAELVQLERSVLLRVLDGMWREHLYMMDQVKDAIGFRSFSQQDPRIEYKREGSRLFREMMDRVRERVAEYIFRMKLTVAPSMPQPSPGAPAGPGGPPRGGAPAQGIPGVPGVPGIPGVPGGRAPGLPQSPRPADAPGGTTPSRLGTSLISGPGLDAPVMPPPATQAPARPPQPAPGDAGGGSALA